MSIFLEWSLFHSRFLSCVYDKPFSATWLINRQKRMANVSCTLIRRKNPGEVNNCQHIECRRETKLFEGLDFGVVHYKGKANNEPGVSDRWWCIMHELVNIAWHKASSGLLCICVKALRHTNRSIKTLCFKINDCWVSFNFLQILVSTNIFIFFS